MTRQPSEWDPGYVPPANPQGPIMDAAWAVVVSALISGPLMWILYRLDKNNTEQHGKAVDLIQSVKDDVQDVKNMQVWMDLKLDKHIEEDHAGNN